MYHTSLIFQIVDARNVHVIITRWYGGVHLGPDRFKHINNLTRHLLLEHGYIKEKVLCNIFFLAEQFSGEVLIRIICNLLTNYACIVFQIKIIPSKHMPHWPNIGLTLLILGWVAGSHICVETLGPVDSDWIPLEHAPCWWA